MMSSNLPMPGHRPVHRTSGGVQYFRVELFNQDSSSLDQQHGVRTEPQSSKPVGTL